MNLINDTGKFIAARGPIHGSHMLIISDYAHWIQNEKAIQSWIEQFGSGIRHEGMTLTFDHDADRTAFLLRWA